MLHMPKLEEEAEDYLEKRCGKYKSWNASAWKNRICAIHCFFIDANRNYIEIISL